MKQLIFCCFELYCVSFISWTRCGSAKDRSVSYTCQQVWGAWKWWSRH